MAPKHKRFYTLLAMLMGLGGIALFLGITLQKNIRFFVTPSQVMEENLIHHKKLRLGGLVKEGSLKHSGLDSLFILTDGVTDVFVTYHGVLPDLFREGQTIVAEGYFDQESQSLDFKADVILAKHDENYRPPNLRQPLSPSKES